ncbi:GntR family transcriptional regulator [Noviherbaspirillum suwonense]|jgi:DNA-binding GntR family transcriptional regulator|uniref:DNA-binding transcriptional regulator, GntR family n=1 Tax=Noviherbaspirillum suwonense TaxID=1224511 RepID=A0ABY1QU06_9BURK|nr:GntR family transcriptional regulator [Noviherbaspirillum suwonense]SMP79970.1 DNA-binding transcriptional regulator, GntR family [Noviherbaspirillum suwonense]
MDMHPQHIVRSSLHDMLVSHLRELILKGELRPGDKLPEQMLCERFGVSRTPMREAVKVLAAEGVLRLQLNRGAIVAETTPQDIEELFPIMAALEAVAGEQACRKASDAQIAQLRALHNAMVGHYEAGEEAAYLRHNRLIHEAIVEMTGNATLAGMYQQMLTRIHCVRFTIGKTVDQWKKAIAEHEQIVTALEQRDGARLAELLKAHVLETTVRITQDYINRLPAAGRDAA